MEPQIGSTIGDYQVIGILGAGGMGKVYKVRNTISDRVEAMKVLLPDLASAPDLADRFLREIKVQASLEHPNIAALHTAIRIDNQLVMLMEFVDGITLDERLKSGKLPVGQALDYIMQVLSALEFAHGRGVIHRDIKPANMMLTPAGAVKLMDFGIAKAANDHKLTMTGFTMGSLYYMSPEQIQGSTTLDARADLYSLGISLYELVTGRRPFDGDSQFAIMSAHLEKTPVPPIELDPNLPQALNDVILMSVMKDPSARFQSATAFRNALGSVAGSSLAATATPSTPCASAAPPPLPVAAPQAAPAPPPVRMAPPAPAAAAAAPVQPKSKRGLWMAIGALAAVAAAVAVIEFAPWRGTRAQTAEQAQTEPQTAPPPAAAPTAQTPAPNPPTAPAEQPPTASAPSGSAAPSPQQAAKPKETHPAPRQTASAAPQNNPAQAPQAVASAPNPPQQASAPPPAQIAPPAAPQPNPHAAELQDLREKLVLMDNRAQSIRDTLANLRRAQQASGLGLGSQYTGPSNLMESYLRGATDALNAGDVDAARRFLEKAEPPTSALEKLLNK